MITALSVRQTGAFSHMYNGKGKIRFGIYACSPEESSFKAVFSNMQVMECQWKAHDGQQPDSNG